MWHATFIDLYMFYMLNSLTSQDQFLFNVSDRPMFLYCRILFYYLLRLLLEIERGEGPFTSCSSRIWACNFLCFVIILSSFHIRVRCTSFIFWNILWRIAIISTLNLSRSKAIRPWSFLFGIIDNINPTLLLVCSDFISIIDSHLVCGSMW